MRTLPDMLAAERAAVAAGTRQPCGKTCDDGCHGTLTGDLACERTAHPHETDNVVAHLGHTPDGDLIQWTCFPGDHDGLTAEQRAARREADAAEATATATRALYASVDPQLLVQLLKDGGHLG